MFTAPIRRLLAAAVVAGCVLAPAASAQAPDGNWTFVRKDGIKHYACKKKHKSGDWNVKTATFWNHDQLMIDEGVSVYAAIARGSDEELVTTRSSNAWKDGYVRMTLRPARGSDRLWIQAALYGPSEPWKDGLPVRRLVRCGAAG